MSCFSLFVFVLQISNLLCMTARQQSFGLLGIIKAKSSFWPFPTASSLLSPTILTSICWCEHLFRPCSHLPFLFSFSLHVFSLYLTPVLLLLESHSREIRFHHEGRPILGSWLLAFKLGNLLYFSVVLHLKKCIFWIQCSSFISLLIYMLRGLFISRRPFLL